MNPEEHAGHGPRRGGAQSLARFEDAARSAGCELRLAAGEGVRGVWDRLRVEQIISYSRTTP